MDLTLTEQRLIGLARTLVRVREDSLFYRALIPQGDDITPAGSPAVLRRLPWLDPARWESVRKTLRTSGFEGIVTGYTNGTSGTPKAFCSTEAEREALRAARVRDGRRRLNLAGFSHGDVVGVGLAGEGDFVPLLSQRYLDLAADLIAHGTPDGSRIQVLATGSARHLKLLTLHMRHRFGDISGFGVQSLEVGREFLSPRWHTRLRQWWGADIDIAYGFSELRMCNALRCRDCGYHHFPPSCVAEVVDPADPERYTPLGGRGALLVTALYPYVQFEPRIRYRPGDLVELAAQPCPTWDEPGFLPLGREAHCLPSGHPGGYLTPADCIAALADLPQIAVGLTHVYPQTDARHLEAGSPRFKLLDDGTGPTVHAELRFDPLVWPQEAETTAQTIRAALPPGTQVALHGPGQLEEPILV